MDKQYNGYYRSPIGTIQLSYSGKGLTTLVFCDKKQAPTCDDLFLQDCCLQLDEYFEGKRKKFDLDLDMNGTEFQMKVWEYLKTIPFGKTISYLTMAKHLGNPKSIRAVGRANAKNPVSIIVPCHRIIGSDGSLTGYAGGLWRKKWLLEHELKYHQLSLF